MKDDQVYRQQIQALLSGGRAHMGLKAIQNFPAEYYNTRPPNVDYTFWHLLEHIRLAQHDILDFIQNPDYETPSWPEDYWPPENSLCNPAQWEASVHAIQNDLAKLRAIAESDEIDLQSDLPYAEGYSYIRELLLVADHNAYHLGEFGILRQVSGLW